MEMLGQDSSSEANQSLLVTEIEVPMMKLSLGDGGGELLYPERPEETDCTFYLRTGVCGYGERCRFNHPRDRNLVNETSPLGQRVNQERVGRPVCEYYMKTGTCKYNAFCKFHHPREGGPSPVSMNDLGYPLRPGEKECAYYIKTGKCKFAANCKFHHPQSDGAQVAASPAPGSAIVPISALYPPTVPSFHASSSHASSSQQYGVPASNWQVSTLPPLFTGFYTQGNDPLLPPQGMVPVSSWSPYLTLVNPVASSNSHPTVGPEAYYGIMPWYPSAPAYTGAYPLIPSGSVPSTGIQTELSYPQQPGQPECRNYIRTGECKFGSFCRYHHPQQLVQSKVSPICLSYAQHGVCQFGQSCKYDHPIGTRLGYSPSTSSLSDTPVAPYPITSPPVSSPTDRNISSTGQASSEGSNSI